MLDHSTSSPVSESLWKQTAVNRGAGRRNQHCRLLLSQLHEFSTCFPVKDSKRAFSFYRLLTEWRVQTLAETPGSFRPLEGHPDDITAFACWWLQISRFKQIHFLMILSSSVWLQPHLSEPLVLSVSSRTSSWTGNRNACDRTDILCLDACGTWTCCRCTALSTNP